MLMRLLVSEYQRLRPRIVVSEESMIEPRYLNSFVNVVDFPRSSALRIKFESVFSYSPPRKMNGGFTADLL